MISQVPSTHARVKCVWFHGIGPVYDPLGSMKNPLRSRMFAWWYFSIAAGFLLLALNRWLLGQRAGLVLAQLAAAAAFVLFGLMSWRGD